MLYLKGRFTFDLLAIIPFYSILEGVIEDKYNRLFYLIKLVRLQRAFELMSTKVFMAEVKSYYDKKLANLIKNYEDLARDQTNDRTHIGKIVSTSYVLKLLQFVLIIFCCSYFIGLLWLIFC